MLFLYDIKDVVWCYLCDIFVFFLYCDVCYINLCKVCVVEYFLDDLVEYKVVLIK